MNGIEFLYVLYGLPLIVCIIASWIWQITEEENFDYMFRIFAFIPVLNLIGSVIFIIITFSYLAGFTITLPTIIKKWMKNK